MDTTKLALLGGEPVRRKPWPTWPQYDNTEMDTLREVLESRRWGRLSGTKVAAFEEAFAKFQLAKHGVAVTNGTAALTVALKAGGIDVGDEVIVPAYTFIATASCVLLNNAVPVFVDVDPETINIDIHAVEKAITPRTRAVIPVHWMGRPADMGGLLAIARRHNLLVVEDSCHGWGGRWNQQGLGAVGHLGAFSFQASKNITAGEGGMILTNDDDLAAKAFSYHHIGRIAGRPFYEHHEVAGNYRMTEFEAAVLLAQLGRLEEQTQRREQNAQYLDAHIGAIDGLRPLRRDPYMTRISWHGYSFFYDADTFGGITRERFMEALRAEGVPSSSCYPHPLYRNPLFTQRRFGRIAKHVTFPDYSAVECPVSEALCKTRYVLLAQSMLLGEDDDTRDILRALEKVRANVAQLRA